jgi:hypothetical protein
MESERFEIPAEFNGPPQSGHGGYVSGRLAALIPGQAEVTLRAPTPLGTPLAIEREDGAVGLRHGEILIAEARDMDELELEHPDPVDLEQAERARSRYRGHHSFRTCFVCGIERDRAQRVFPGPIEDRTQAATPWTPSDRWLADERGLVRPEFIWSVLDCPTYFGFFADRDPGLAMLGRFAVRRVGDVPLGEPHLITAWRTGQEGRKLFAGGALFSAAGELRALARATMIAIDEIPQGARA